MIKAALILAVGALLGAAPALAGDASATTPSIGSTCLTAGASTIQGTLVTSSPGSLTMTVERGIGPLLAFGAAKLMLPIAPNASRLGSPHKGDTVVVHALACPNPERTMVSTVVAKIEVAAKSARKATAPRKTTPAKR